MYIISQIKACKGIECCEGSFCCIAAHPLAILLPQTWRVTQPRNNLTNISCSSFCASICIDPQFCPCENETYCINRRQDMRSEVLTLFLDLMQVYVV
jgi:hypothetical protein